MAIEHNTHGGGAQTNINGLQFERDTSLDDAFVTVGYSVKNYEIHDSEDLLIGLSVQKHKLYSEFLAKNGINYKDYNSKKWLPDEAFINYTNNTVYIIEKKYQKTEGSVDEKLPNCDFKKKEYEKLFHPLGYEVRFIYVLSSFFDKDKYNDFYDYITAVGCEYYFNELPFEAIGLEDNN